MGKSFSVCPVICQSEENYVEKQKGGVEKNATCKQ